MSQVYGLTLISCYQPLSPGVLVAVCLVRLVLAVLSVLLQCTSCRMGGPGSLADIVNIMCRYWGVGWGGGDIVVYLNNVDHSIKRLDMKYN